MCVCFLFSYWLIYWLMYACFSIFSNSINCIVLKERRKKERKKEERKKERKKEEKKEKKKERKKEDRKIDPKVSPCFTNTMLKKKKILPVLFCTLFMKTAMKRMIYILYALPSLSGNQCIHTSYWSLQNLIENWSWTLSSVHSPRTEKPHSVQRLEKIWEQYGNT